MGLKLLMYGPYGGCKTNLSATMAEIGNIGVIDTEQRWHWLTVPHPTEPPRIVQHSGVDIPAYAHPRMLRQDVPWLPKTRNVVWVVQTMETNTIQACIQTWAADHTICGQVLDSVSVLWDLYSDDAYERMAADAERQEDGVSRLGGLAWVPAKKAIRRTTYAQMAGGQHFIQVAHKQELLNKKMEVIGSKPWTEKSTPKWVDLVIQVVRDEGKEPRARVELQKVLGGVGTTSLGVGTVIEAPTFKRILELAGQADDINLAGPVSMEEIERRAGMLVSRVASLPDVQDPTKGTNNQGGK